MNITNLLKNFDHSISKLGLFMSILSIFYVQNILTGRLKYFSLTFLVGIAVTLFIYTILREKIKPIIPRAVYIKYKNTHFKMFIILYILLYLQSIYLLFHHLYNRPLVYFITISFICVLVVLQIQIFSKQQFMSMIILFEILLISLNLRWGIIYEFPSIIGVDPTYHLNIAMQIVNLGEVPTGSLYGAHPIMHILIATMNLLGGLSPKNSIVFSTGFEVAVLLPMFTYIICKKIFTVQTALISALFVAISNYLIWYGYILFATSMGLVYFVILLFFILCAKSLHHKATLTILFFIIIVLTHPLSNVLFLFSVIVLSLFQIHHFNLYYNRQKRMIPFISMNIIILFFSFTLAYWIYSIPSSSDSFFAFILKTLVAKLTITEPIPSTLSISFEGVTLLNEILNTLGTVLLLCLGIIGSLHTIRTVRNNLVPLYVVSLGFFLFFFAAFSEVIGFENILPERWFGFASLLFAIPASVGFQLIYNTSLNKKFALVFQSIFIFILTFFLVTSSIANMDTPIYSKNISLRTGFFESELVAADFFGTHSNTTFVTDHRYSPMREFDNRGISFLGLVSFDEISANDIVIIREYVLNNRFEAPARNPSGAKTVTIDQDFLNNLELQKVSKIYSNKIVNMYLIS